MSKKVKGKEEIIAPTIEEVEIVKTEEPQITQEEIDLTKNLRFEQINKYVSDFHNSLMSSTTNHELKKLRKKSQEALKAEPVIKKEKFVCDSLIN